MNLVKSGYNHVSQPNARSTKKPGLTNKDSPGFGLRRFRQVSFLNRQKPLDSSSEWINPTQSGSQSQASLHPSMSAFLSGFMS